MDIKSIKNIFYHDNLIQNQGKIFFVGIDLLIDIGNTNEHDLVNILDPLGDKIYVGGIFGAQFSYKKLNSCRRSEFNATKVDGKGNVGQWTIYSPIYWIKSIPNRFLMIKKKRYI